MRSWELLSSPELAFEKALTADVLGQPVDVRSLCEAGAELVKENQRLKERVTYLETNYSPEHIKLEDQYSELWDEHRAALRELEELRQEVKGKRVKGKG